MNCPSKVIASMKYLPCSSHSGLSQLFPDLGTHTRPRGLLDDLLVPTLYRTIPLEEVDIVAVLVPEHLDLDVARRLHVLLYQHHLDLIFETIISYLTLYYLHISNIVVGL